MSLLSFLTGTTDQAEQDANLARQQQQLADAIRRREDAGTITPERAAELRAYDASVYDDSEWQATNQGFQEGFQEGFNNVLNAPGKLVGGVGDSLGQALGGILKNIPWWVYLGLFIGGFFYLGGGIWLRRRVARA
jgi:hypothetical protein